MTNVSQIMTKINHYINKIGPISRTIRQFPKEFIVAKHEECMIHTGRDGVPIFKTTSYQRSLLL